jgi:hypothetical protein
MPEEPKIDINQILSQTSNSMFDGLLGSNACALRVSLEAVVSSIEETPLFGVELGKLDLKILDKENLSANIETSAKLANVLVALGRRCLNDYELAITDRAALLLWCFRATKIFDAYVEIMISTAKWLKGQEEEHG